MVSSRKKYVAALLVCFGSSLVGAADKYETYGSLAVFGRFESSPLCTLSDRTVTAALEVKRRFYFSPSLTAALETPNSLSYKFSVEGVPEFSPPSAGPAFPLKAWRTFAAITAGVWDVSSVQQLSTGDRLSDAIRFVVPNNDCAGVKLGAVEVLDGDLQVSRAGQSFPLSSVRVKVHVLDAGVAPINVSVALASTLVASEIDDSGIDGPRTAALTDANGIVTFPITPGSRAGIKRFVVKARSVARSDKAVASTILTLAHVPAGAPTLASVPVVEYQYAGGTGANPRYLASTAAATQLLDSFDDPAVRRTGQVWRAFTAPNAAPGLAPVCQFFGRPSNDPAITHFFTADAAECAFLQSLASAAPAASGGLKYEGIAFYAVVPDSQQRCPLAFPIPIIRYFVASPAPHHQYLVGDATNGEPLSGVAREAVREKTVFCTDVATDS